MYIQEIKLSVPLKSPKEVHLTQYFPDQAKTAPLRPRALVIGVHGFGEHAGRYLRLAEATFTKLGCVFMMPDLPGHGQTEGQRGLTNFSDIEWVIRETARFAAAQYPQVPLILFGHSMGGGVVLDMLNHDSGQEGSSQNVFYAGIIMSPWLRPFSEPKPWLVAMAWLMAKIKPDFTLNAQLNYADLTDDLLIQKETSQDGLYHNRICYKLYSDMKTAGQRSLQDSSRLALPLLFMVGGQDRITHAEANRDLARRMNGRVTFSYWPEMRHELHNSTGRQEVYQTINDFLMTIRGNP